MPQNKIKKDETKTKTPAINQEKLENSPSSTNTTLLAMIVVLLLLIVLGGVGAFGWYWWRNREQKVHQLQSQVESQVQTQAGNELTNENSAPPAPQPQGLVYENQKYGFRLNFTPSWENYRAESNDVSNSFEANRTCFFLPTQYSQYTDELPDYTSPFCISAYPANTWDQEAKKNSVGMGSMGEVVGRNSQYVLVYSHFNGDMPPDVPQQAINDMPNIAKGIAIFEPVTNSNENNAAASENTGTIDNPASSTRPTVDPDFQMSGVYYWNCKHRYTLTYPATWSNNGMNENSNLVILKGNQMQLWVEAIPIMVTDDLQSFAKKQAPKIPGELTWVESIAWSGEADVLRATYHNPDSVVLWWQAGDYGIQVRAIGNGSSDELARTFDTMATLDPNKEIYQCNHPTRTTQNSGNPTNTNQSNNDCAYPKGDVKDWWCQATKAEQDCYEQKIGDSGVKDSHCKWGKTSKDIKCSYPKGDPANWWDDASDSAKACYIDSGGTAPSN